MNIVYVDKNDSVIASGTKQNAMENGIAVRISRVFLINPSGELLIQKRSPKVALPYRWDQSAAGHVDEGEDYKTAAYRELKEEMGIDDVTLKFLAKYYTEEHDEALAKKRFNMLFIGDYQGKVKIDKDEVSAFRWISRDDLRNEMSQSPDKFTEGFREAFKIFIANS